MYFVTTRNCNLRCGHCYMGGRPGLKDTTISDDDFKKAVNNLPKVPISLKLSGGEIFTVPDSLFSFLGHIQDVNKERKRSHKGRIETHVQTNAFWAMKKNPVPVLEKLANLGVEGLDITSNDPFHQKQGIHPDKLYSLREKAREYFPIVGVRGGPPMENAMPTGRPRMNGVPMGYHSGGMCEGVFDDLELTVDEKGDVYPCCFNFFKFPGNLIEEPLTKILKRAKKEKRLHELNWGGPKALARLEGVPFGRVNKLVYDHGDCGACFELFSKDCKY